MQSDLRFVVRRAPFLIVIDGMAATGVSAAARKHLGEWYQQGVTAQELADHQGNLTGSFKIALSTTDGMAQALLNAVNRGQSVAWLDEYPVKINALTVAEVNGAIKKHLNPEKMFLVKAGTIPGAVAK